MRTADPLELTVATYTNRHPDRHSMAAAREAIEHWLQQPMASSPTSSLTGGGAILEFERQFSLLHDGRLSLLLPSATYGLYLGLAALGVGPGSEVIVPAIDWPASLSAVLALGARPVIVPVDPETLTLDPLTAGKAMTIDTRAVVVCHLNGVCADVPAIRSRTCGVPIIEDCAGALGSSLDGARAGTFGDLAVFSLGPSKQIDAGEGGILVCADQKLYERLVGGASHPIRAALIGITRADPPQQIALRPHPLTAVLALHSLAQWDAEAKTALNLQAEGEIAPVRAQILGGAPRRTNAQSFVPVLVEHPDQTFGVRSGAQLIGPQDSDVSSDLLSRSRLVPCPTRHYH